MADILAMVSEEYTIAKRGITLDVAQLLADKQLLYQDTMMLFSAAQQDKQIIAELCWWCATGSDREEWSF